MLLRSIRLLLCLHVALIGLWGWACLRSIAQQPGANVTAAQVNEGIKRCVNFLYGAQEVGGRLSGGWKGYDEYGCGQTALVTLSLLSAGERPNDLRVKKALDLVRRTRPTMTYEVALHCMALCAAEPNRDMASIKKDVEMLVESQDSGGGWGYSKKNPVPVDESNTQFAVLALWEASKLGIAIPDETWARSQRYWDQTHTGSGWGYRGDRKPKGSMTCAGIASLLIVRDAAENGDATIVNGQIECCGNSDERMRADPVAQGFTWLSDNFTVDYNPFGSGWSMYYLYALERVGRLTGQRFFGVHDWYREGAARILNMQRNALGRIQGSPGEDDVTATAMALLFLSKGKRQVVVGHLRHGNSNDWQLHRRAVQNLTGQIEKVWKRELAWQSVTINNATVESLLETPILFISGSKEFRLDDRQRAMLASYVDQGGLIFAEACNGDGCNGEAFDTSFRAEMERVFDKPLTKLPPSHAVWSAEARIDPNAMPEGFWLYGLDACCRTSVIYSPISLTCRWELARPWGTLKKISPANQADIENAVKIGVNVAAYATGRELKDKLDAVEVIQAPANYQNLSRGTLKLAKIDHTGGANDASRAITHLLDVYHRETKGLIDREVPVLPLGSDEIEKYPLLYIHGRTRFVFSDADRDGLKRHIENGGFVMGDAICASKEFTTAVREEFAKALPESKWRPLDPSHPMIKGDESVGFNGYDLRSVALVDPAISSGDLNRSKREGPPEIEALEWNGKIVMLFTPNDISCAMESKHSIQCRGYIREDAFRIGTNMVLFGLSQ